MREHRHRLVHARRVGADPLRAHLGASDGRGYVVPDDVKDLAVAVLSHRIKLTAEATFAGLTTDEPSAGCWKTVPARRSARERRSMRRHNDSSSSEARPQKPRKPRKPKPRNERGQQASGKSTRHRRRLSSARLWRRCKRAVRRFFTSFISPLAGPWSSSASYARPDSRWFAGMSCSPSPRWR